MDFSDTIEIKVVDKIQHSGYSVDSYFFAYFKDQDHALEEIRAVVGKYRRLPSENDTEELVKDTTLARSNSGPAPHPEHAHTLPEDPKPSVLRKVLKPFSTADGLVPLALTGLPIPFSGKSKAPEAPTQSDELSSSTSSIVGRRTPGSPGATRPSLSSASSHGDSSSDHTYPPSVLHRPVELLSSVSSTVSAWSLPTVPTWLRSPKLFSSNSSHQTGISEVVSAVQPAKEQDHPQEMGFSILEAHDATQEHIVDPQRAARFKQFFALDGREVLLGCAL